MVLDELQRATSIEKMGRYGVAKAVAGVPRGKACLLAVLGEEGLDLALPQRTIAAREERVALYPNGVREVSTSKVCYRREQRPLGPIAVLETTHDDARATEINVAALEERDLPDTEPVEVDDQEEQAVAAVVDDAEEPADLVLRQVLRELLWERH